MHHLGDIEMSLQHINRPNTADRGARVHGSNSTIRCFKCGEAVHKAGDCRKPNSCLDKDKKLMIVDENLDDAD
ncbi:hypothetical protein AMTR_s00005p00252120 [Amborella trichopoda]|uniref:CCHC-type domain-containing protein n=1 Tax=Amborella trichopoda TaxID=13333 RepID=W1PGW9_AMBTC|nr:hypothetical protein AMTR_s00005p00252120 [Amborella trichopoda]